MKRNILKTFCFLALATAVVNCGNRKKAEKTTENAAEEAVSDSLKQIEMEEKLKSAEETIALLPEEPVFKIETNLGTMKVKLYGKTPKHRYNFAKLALTGYYDNLLFHRVIKDFMIQGGDPFTKDTAMVSRYGQGGPDYTVPAEFVAEYKHKKGALAAARRGDAANPKKESSGSQFYIVHSPENCAQLDGEYTVFGETIEGWDVIDKIAEVATNMRDLPINPVCIISVKLDEKSMPALPENTEAKETEEKADNNEQLSKK